MEGPIKHAGIIGDAENDRVRVAVDIASIKDDKGRTVVNDNRDIFQAIDGCERLIFVVF